MRLPQMSHGCENYTIKHWSTRIPFLVEEERQSTVDALERNPSGRRTIIRNDITTGSITPQGGVITRQPRVAVTSKPKRSSKERIKSSTVAIYASVFALLISVVAIGYRAPQETNALASESVIANTSTAMARPTANDVVAANIAASVASVADLAVAGNVAELAVATQVQSQYAAAEDGSAISKPTIIELSSASRKITTYTVLAGDTVPSVAAKFGLSSDTIRWANDLTGDTLSEGKVLDILPRNGITYTVKSGDTVKKLADKYKANASLITTYNDLEISGLTPGLKIIIPNGILPTNERPGYVSPAATNTFFTGYSAGAGSGRTWYVRSGTPNRGNYAWGNCTAYAFDRRAALGRPIGANWGNAGSWAWSARAAGYVVNRTPAAGAVIQDWGHVAIVEKVLPNGDLELSEMNYFAFGASGANNVVSGRILPAAYVSQYYYIH